MPPNPGPLTATDCVQWAPPSAVANTVDEFGLVAADAKQTLVEGQLMALKLES
jgi:hypothetical protein